MKDRTTRGITARKRARRSPREAAREISEKKEMQGTQEEEMDDIREKIMKAFDAVEAATEMERESGRQYTSASAQASGERAHVDTRMMQGKGGEHMQMQEDAAWIHGYKVRYGRRPSKELM